MAITLRIVGIFYRQDVSLPNGSGTVKEVMDAAVVSPGAGRKFSYNAPGNSPSVFFAEYTQSFPSPTPGVGNTYPPGPYTLAENLQGNPYSVWQYYIFDKGNVYLNRGKGAVPFDQAVVPDGGSVVWRLINVLAGPMPAAGRVMGPLSLTS